MIKRPKNRYRSIIYLLLTLLLLLIGLFVWATLRKWNEERAAYADTLIRPAVSFPLSLKWQIDLGRSTYEYPAYQDGLVLMPADGIMTSNWYGIDAQTGQMVWEQWTKVVGEPWLGHNYLRCLTSQYLVISGSWSFMAFDTRTGDLVWKKDHANIASCSETMIFYSEVPRNSVSTADLVTGQDLWRGTEPSKNFSGLIYNSGAGELLGTHAGDFYVIEPQTGQLKHSFPIVSQPSQGGPPWGRGSMFLIDRGELFVGTAILDARTGEVIHKENRYGSGLLPTVTVDTMYFPSLSDGVVAFDRSNYEVKWIYPSPLSKIDAVPLDTISSVAILDGIGYIIFDDATLRAFDLDNGQELGYWQPSKEDLMDWRVCTYPNPRSDCIVPARAGLATSEDTLFVSFGDGKLYAFGK